jgi:long-chain fatty acid transport protein
LKELNVMIKNHIMAAAVTAAIVLPGAAMATNGYFMHGAGIKSKGMGGVGIALPQDAIASGSNPAGIGFVGNRLDFGIEVFSPTREARISGNDITGFPTGSPPPFDKVPPQFGGMNNGKFHGDSDNPFYIPEFGVNYWLNDSWALGVSVVGNGGMNTNYAGMTLMNGKPFDTEEETGINIEQVRILPTVAYKINENHSVGFTLQVIAQRFNAWGLGAFKREGGPMAGQVSAYPDNVSDKGYTVAWGVGWSVGWTGKITDTVTLGAMYNAKVDMDEFSDYKGLFAQKGDFDVPENYGLGIAWQATPRMQLGFDIVQINYSNVKSVANSIQSGHGGLDMFNPNNYLGTSNGSGFGWDDMTVYKLGIDYDLTDAWTIRAGWNHSDQPIDKDQTMFNILAPAVVEDHLTVGGTYTLPNGSQLSFYYFHAFENKVRGKNSIPAAFGGGEADIKMSQDAMGLSYGFNF